jgi:hypothetical protein
MRGQPLLDGISVISSDHLLLAKKALLGPKEFEQFKSDLERMTNKNYGTIFSSGEDYMQVFLISIYCVVYVYE